MLRATFAGFTTAYSALQANQKRLDIVGQNLANMNTPGYTRQALKTSSLNYTHPVAHYTNGSETVVGFGVHMDAVTQLRDPYLDAQYRDQIKKSGYADAFQTSLDRLSRVLDESTINGIHMAFNEIQTCLDNMQDVSKINDPIYESELRARMQALTNLLNDADRQITEAEKAEYNRLDGSSSTMNGAEQEIDDILKRISTLNRQIKDNQIFGQPSLELMDERNMLLDELASYIPIEVTYYKDLAHDGIDANGQEDLSEIYHLDANGHPFEKKDWPDDVRVDMLYVDDQGVTQRLTLIEGTVGSGYENMGDVDISLTDPNDPTSVKITFTGSAYKYTTAANNSVQITQPNQSITLGPNNDPNNPETHLPVNGGSVQASLDMLWKDGSNGSVKGYEFYRGQLDTLANAFATVVNQINIAGSAAPGNPNGPNGSQFLLTPWDGNTKITAGNITINPDWSSGNVHVGKAGESANETVLNLLGAMSTSWPLSKNTFVGADGNPIQFGNIDLENNSFADYMNYTATILANDSYTNTQSLKTNVTVLNGIQSSRDSISGVSLDEEAASMMAYMSAYNAASRLMTTLDEALNVLINNTGLVGR
ncbi:MAG: flagellar biosynthesis protein FlgK [Lachnospiraceae bacterium]|jgi:flagellar hook-associated protein 1 FlgK|nr:flagellar biosynthesis protein FlgK [Lachnospiraceae bacterium]